MPKFEANMNYIPPSPPSSMKQCNKSATVKFHMELLLTTTTWKQSHSGATPICFIKGFYVSASGAIEGHHGLLVFETLHWSNCGVNEMYCSLYHVVAYYCSTKHQ